VLKIRYYIEHAALKIMWNWNYDWYTANARRRKLP